MDKIKKCDSCNKYTLKNLCPSCGKQTVTVEQMFSKEKSEA